MEQHLTEIKNAHLFMEYLMCIGVKSPRSRRDDWELVDKERVLARIKKDKNGDTKFFICAALLGRR
ncbi:hypothetical protein [Tolumonas lignilytica]|jgi:hypothetical protein|uniref:hypothetical protein n=1 Tax=Tolumonas lignilytica TaxID=1283284 RepID=UPI000463BEA1|nr:hypothetical protein [Tolumonas lignilytica]